MKFNCDYFKDKYQAREDRLFTNHKWFAWYPVKVDSNDCRWLEYVNREAWCTRAFHFTYEYTYSALRIPKGDENVSINQN